jgi:uncharacterized membrane protein
MEKLGFDFNSEKTAVMAIAIVLVIVASTIAIVFVVWPRSGSSGYSTIYLLDDQNQAVNYPDVLVINHNNSLTVPVVVENHMDTKQYYQLQVKIVQETTSFPLEEDAYATYETQLKDKESWQNTVPLSINQLGDYSVVFELWSKDKEAETYSFTYNFCVLHIKVVANPN